MELIADETYYLTVYNGSIPPEQLPLLLKYASYDIYTLIKYAPLDGLHDSIITDLKEATCMQADFLYSTNPLGLDIKSLSADGESITYSDNSSTKTSSRIKSLIKSTGLCYRGFY